VHFEELMRFTISREKLQEGLAAVAASIPGKTTLPVLANILVETTERGIRFSGTDLDIHVSHEVQADVERAGGITIPAKKRAPSRSSPPANKKSASNADGRSSN
jgi:DNA polymerase III subunit beta